MNELPDDFNGIPAQDTIGSHQRKSLGLTLGDQEAIEGVPVVVRQLKEAEYVSCFDRQDGADAQCRHMFMEEFPTLRKVQFARAHLECDLPQAGRAEQQLVGLISDDPGGAGREPWRFAGDAPQEDVGVQ